jgi:hypothetical protein
VELPTKIADKTSNAAANRAKAILALRIAEIIDPKLIRAGNPL